MQFATRGDRQSPAILFFHAMGVTGASSEPVARYLQQNYYCQRLLRGAEIQQQGR